MKRLVLVFMLINFYALLYAQNLDSLLEQAVYSSGILSKLDSCRPVFVYKVLGKTQKKLQQRYYLLLYAASYKFSNDELIMCQGYSDAAVLDVEAGKVKIFLPSDGDYTGSIRKLFPTKLQHLVFERYKIFRADSVEECATKKALKVWNLRRVTVFMPQNLREYENLMDKYYFEGGANPLEKIKFYPSKVLMPDTADIYRLTAIAAYRQYPPFGNKNNAQIAYFKKVQDTIYILTNADVDGWAGVTNYLQKVHPIITKSLLALPDVTVVEWKKR